MSSEYVIEAQMTFFFRDVGLQKMNNFWTKRDKYGYNDIAACTAAGNTLCRQPVPSLVRLAVTITYLKKL